MWILIRIICVHALTLDSIIET